MIGIAARADRTPASALSEKVIRQVIDGRYAERMVGPKNPFRYFNSSPEVIRLVVMMYVK
ncbi:MAG: hypothetical protein EPO59_20360 [Bosea sp. (in: a-proteobacteria)]|nr:MAG: hypothetical protein EPO59_20360 [Bosea sp. (in: a-proteobacteria)]